ncbi:hypothetical protein HY750_00995 [Candidatus Kuenenbacteria bacterium]|nr:hypothetical protein [Candidatus Kuenenbacteria bacterium]
MNQEIKICQNCEKEFTIESEDFLFYEKIKVPPPTFCPECREQRRITFRNERALYKRKCDLCGQIVVSRVSPNKPYLMYCQKCWWSDKWGGEDYGKDYDFNKPFFEQFKNLLFSTPHISIFNANCVNSDWVNQETDDKNCYLNIGGLRNEDSAYNTYELYGKDCFDNFWISKSELCYQNINCERCYKALFSQDCFDCYDAILSFDCRNCSNILGCAGLRYKQYYIFNKPYSKEEYQKFLKENSLTSYKNILFLKDNAKKIWLSTPHRDRFILKSNNCFGHSIIHSKNVKNCWNGECIEDSKHLYITGWIKDSYDLSSFGYGELCYEGAHSGGCYNSKFFLFVLGAGTSQTKSSFNLEYCYAVLNSHNCFGCANLRNKEYCILNKQYTKEEYEKLVPKIIEHMNEMPYISKNQNAKIKSLSRVESRDQNDNLKFKNEENAEIKEIIYRYGEFFPPELSPFGYNETATQDYYPLSREKALGKGYLWSDYESQIKYAFSDYKIPDNISDVKDDILEKILKCEISNKAYKIIPMELEFYRKIGLPIPRYCPLQRHKDRLVQLSPRKLFQRKCQCNGKESRIMNNELGIKYKNTIEHFHGDQPCPNEFETTYAPDRQEIIYCEKCYLSEVV